MNFFYQNSSLCNQTLKKLLRNSAQLLILKKLSESDQTFIGLDINEAKTDFGFT